MFVEDERVQQNGKISIFQSKNDWRKICSSPWRLWLRSNLVVMIEAAVFQRFESRN